MSWTPCSTKFEPKVDAYTLYEYYRTKPDPPCKLFDIVIGRQGVRFDAVLKQLLIFDKTCIYEETEIELNKFS